MFPQLTTGAINRILNGEDVANAVMQILGCKNIPGGNNDRYRLLISDGVTGCPFALLGTRLNHMVANKELEKFTIVRVDKCVCNQVQADRKVIILLSLTVLVPGNEVNEKLGNPVCSSTGGVSTGAATDGPVLNGVAKTGYPDQNAIPAQDSSLINGSTKLFKPQLTAGAINRILNGEGVTNAVMQILCYKKIPGTGTVRYRLLISDGVHGCPFAMLGTQLNHMVANKELEKFTIVRVDKCVCNQVQADQKVIILLSLTVLVPGNEVNEKLGNPVNSSTGGVSTGAATDGPVLNGAAKTGYPDQNAIPAQDSSLINGSTKSFKPQLTAGAINRILNGEGVANAVMQILCYKKIPGAGGDRYRLLISDGVHGCSFAMLGTQLNHMAANKELEKFTIVRVDKYVCNQVQADQKVIILLSLTVLVPGNEVNEKLGNPVNSSTGGVSTEAAIYGPVLNGAAKTGYSNVNGESAHDSAVLNGPPQLVLVSQCPPLRD